MVQSSLSSSRLFASVPKGLGVGVRRRTEPLPEYGPDESQGLLAYVPVAVAPLFTISVIWSYSARSSVVMVITVSLTRRLGIGASSSPRSRYSSEKLPGVAAHQPFWPAPSLSMVFMVCFITAGSWSMDSM